MGFNENAGGGKLEYAPPEMAAATAMRATESIEGENILVGVEGEVKKRSG